MFNNPPHNLQIGDGITLSIGSDRWPATVIELLGAGKVKVQSDHCTRTDNNGLSECQSYEFARDPNGAISVIYQNKHGRWRIWGKPHYGVGVNGRSAYDDPCF